MGSGRSIGYVQDKVSGPVELLRKLSRDVATYFNVANPNRRGSAVDPAKDIKALMVNLKESQVHTFVSGRKIKRTGKKKEKVAVDIFTKGKEVLEHRAFRDWKNRTGKFGADLFGCDMEYQHEQEDEEGGTGGSAEFDVEAELEMENEL